MQGESLRQMAAQRRSCGNSVLARQGLGQACSGCPVQLFKLKSSLTALWPHPLYEETERQPMRVPVEACRC